MPAIEVREPEPFIIKSPKGVKEVENSEPEPDLKSEKIETYRPDFDEDLENSGIQK